MAGRGERRAQVCSLDQPRPAVGVTLSCLWEFLKEAGLTLGSAVLAVTQTPQASGFLSVGEEAERLRLGATFKFVIPTRSEESRGSEFPAGYLEVPPPPLAGAPELPGVVQVCRAKVGEGQLVPIA